MKKIIYPLIFIFLLLALSACSKQNKGNNNINDLYQDFSYKVEPETFDLTIITNGKNENVSKALDKMKVTNLKENSSATSWSYPEKGIDVVIKKEQNYLDINIKSTKGIDVKNEFTWPLVSGKNYTLPLGEGKYIPSDDKYFKEYLDNAELDPIESLSMSFFTSSNNDTAVVYIIKNIFNNKMTFNTKNDIEFQFEHAYPSITGEKSYGFRIYITKTTPVNIAKIYKNYIIEQGNFKTLEDKAKDNKNIKKLYGAIHIYLFNKTVISENDINWAVLKENIASPQVQWIKTLLTDKVEGGSEVIKALDDIQKQNYVDQYQKLLISQGLSQVLLLPDFYNPEIFTKKDKKIEDLINKGINNLNKVEIIELNKRALRLSIENGFKNDDDWSLDRNLDLLKSIHSDGIDRAWFGLDDWTQAFISPSMIKYANGQGFLIGPYDSYHSIHEPSKEKWNTAAFKDTSLYENSVITDENGDKISGFQNVGRKLNPVLSIPSVKQRVEYILNTGVKFNSWFIDCDATGEIYDDYSKNHITTKQQDLKARMERISYIRDEKNMVVGSEGGNDFAASTIAFAHGIELPSFSWMDEDMARNKDSQYYLGRYYSGNGGAPEKMTKEVPLKEKYKKIFLDNYYNIPLYKLVYNDSVITTYHWDWSTFKLKDEVQNRMLYEVLYNVPSLYHLDKFQWEKYKDKIISHYKIWSPFSRSVITKEMTDFKILSSNRLVQMTQYGNDIKVIANFSDENFEYNNDKIKAHSLIIYNKSEKIEYTP